MLAIFLPLSFRLSCARMNPTTSPKSGRHSRHLILLPICLLLAACASPGSHPGSERNTDSGSIPSQHAKLRPSTSAPDWSALRQALDASAEHNNILVSELDDGEGLKLEIPVSEGFASGSSAIRGSLASVLDSLAPALRSRPGLRITIIGHTDSIGSEMFNLRLSISRAEAVQAYLAGQGVPLNDLSADGHGEAEPVADNATEEGRARNRRVELILRAPS